MRLARFALLLLAILAPHARVAAAPAAAMRQATASVQWYRGIVPGQSRREDVLKALGTPASTSANGGDDGVALDVLQFRLDDAVFESAQVEIEQDTGLVHSLLLTPKAGYPLRNLFKSHGRRYAVRDPEQGRCSGRKFTPARDYDPGLDEPQGSDALYVYAEGQLEAAVNGGGQVESIGFHRGCPGQLMSYRGIVPGQSRRDEVLKLFGTPSGRGTAELRDLPGRRFDELGFGAGDAGSGPLRVLFEPGSDVVFAIRLLAPPRYQTNELLKAYGENYAVRDPYQDRCTNEKFTPGKDYSEGLDQRQDSDASYVYGHGQLAVFVDGGGNVRELVFRQRCLDRTGKP